jgi:hypothetical protein
MPLSGCFVPQSKYDDAVGKLKAEQELHLRAENEVARVKADIQRIDDILRNREQSLATQEGELAQTKLDSDRTSNERDDQAQLVDQLRGELARVGDHLRDFSNQKQQLETALTETQARAQRLEKQEATVRDKVLVMRDLAFGLGEFVADEKAIVTALGGKPAVRLDGKTAFGKQGEPTAETKAMLERIARAAGPRASVRLAVVDRMDDTGKTAERTARLTSLSALLTKNGMPRDRIDLGDVTPPPAEGGTVYPTPVPPGTVAAAPAKPAETPPKAATLPAKPGRWQDGPGSIELTFDVANPA